MVLSGTFGADPIRLFGLEAKLPDAIDLAAPSPPRHFVAKLLGEQIGPFGKRLCERSVQPLVPAPLALHLVADLSRGLDGTDAGGVPLRTLVGGGIADFFTRGSPIRLPALVRSFATSPDLFWWPQLHRPACNRAFDGTPGQAGLFEALFTYPTNLPPGLSGVLASQASWLRRVTADPGKGEPAVVVVAPSVESVSGCNRSSEEMAALAADALARRPRIRTHVIAIGPPSAELDALAAAGGTDQAISVPVDGDVAAGVSDALQGIRVGYRCDFGLFSTSSTLAFTGADELVVTHAGTEILRVESCPEDGVGWLADDDEHPRWLRMCAATCDAAYASLSRRDLTVTTRLRCDQ
jgi:hypothetical protein